MILQSCTPLDVLSNAGRTWRSAGLIFVHDGKGSGTRPGELRCVRMDHSETSLRREEPERTWNPRLGAWSRFECSFRKSDASLTSRWCGCFLEKLRWAFTCTSGYAGDASQPHCSCRYSAHAANWAKTWENVGHHRIVSALGFASWACHGSLTSAELILFDSVLIHRHLVIGYEARLNAVAIRLGPRMIHRTTRSLP